MSSRAYVWRRAQQTISYPLALHVTVRGGQPFNISRVKHTERVDPESEPRSNPEETTERETRTSPLIC